MDREPTRRPAWRLLALPLSCLLILVGGAGCARDSTATAADREVTPIPIERWWFHRGELPAAHPVDHRSTPFVHRLTSAAFREEARTYAEGHRVSPGWQEVRLPWNLPEVDSVADPSAPVWMLSAFAFPPHAGPWARALWLDGLQGVVSVYVNGEWVGSVGDQTGEPWTRDSRAPVFIIASSLLRGGDQNVVVLKIEHGLGGGVLASASVDNVSKIPARMAWRGVGVRIPQHAAQVVLCCVALMAFVGFVSYRRRRVPDSIALVYAGSACSGLAAIVWAQSVQWAPIPPVAVHRVAVIALHVASCASMLFILVRYRPATRFDRELRLTAWGWAGGLVVAAPFVPGAALQIRLFAWSLAPAFAVGVGSAYLAFRAWKRGVVEAKGVGIGVAVLLVASALDVILVGIYGIRIIAFFPIGALVCVAATLIGMAWPDALRRQKATADRASALAAQATRRELLVRIAEASHDLQDGVRRGYQDVDRRIAMAHGQALEAERARRTLDALILSGSAITDTAQAVVDTADRAREHTSLVERQMSELVAHTDRIVQTLESIKGVAKRADLLAVNAALESLQAGAAGAGVSLVASRLQDLAEIVMDEVRDIEILSNKIIVSARATFSCLGEAEEQTSNTADGVRNIARLVHEQHGATERVSRAMDDTMNSATRDAERDAQDGERLRQLHDAAQQLVELIQDLGEEAEPDDGAPAGFASV